MNETPGAQNTVFTPIRVSTLRGDMQIPFDVYVRVAGKHILYCRSGSSFEGVRLARLKSKKLKQMFIRPEDEIPYGQYMEQNIDQAYDRKSNKSPTVRAEVIQGFQQAAAEQFIESPDQEMFYNHLHSSMQRFVEFLKSDPDGGRALLNMENVDQSITHHSVNVAALAVLMVLESKLKTTEQLQNLATGCLLHDIEHTFSGFDVARSVANLDPVELKTYHSHPADGAGRLKHCTFIDQLVFKIIEQHEENANGTGFPRNLSEREMDPLVLFAATANYYDRLVSFERKQPKEAVRHMMIEKLGLYPLDNLQILQRLLKKLNLV